LRWSELTQEQAQPLDYKITVAKQIIDQALALDVLPALAFSGGKDSTVLLHLIRQAKPNIYTLYGNTGGDSVGFGGGTVRSDIIRTEGAFDKPVDGNLHGHAIQTRHKKSQSHHATGDWYVNRGVVRELWDGLPVVREVAPAAYEVCSHRDNRQIKRRTHWDCKCCKWRADCTDNTKRGGATMCETLIVVQVGNREMSL